MGLFSRKTKSTTTETVISERAMTGRRAAEYRRSMALNDAVHDAAREQREAIADADAAIRRRDIPGIADAAARMFETNEKLRHAKAKRCGGHNH